VEDVGEFSCLRPLLNRANHYILARAQYNPQILAASSAAHIAGQLRNPPSPVAPAIDGSAKIIIAAVTKSCTPLPPGRVTADGRGPHSP
jgi:hypothetical protein